jgi:hypothetical protein
MIRTQSQLILVLAYIWLFSSCDSFLGTGRRVPPATRPTWTTTSFAHVSTSHKCGPTGSNTRPDDVPPTMVILVSKRAKDQVSKFGVESPVECPSVLEAAQHLALKTNFFCDGRLQTHVLTIGDNNAVLSPTSVRDANVVLAYGLEDADELKMAHSLFQDRQEMSNGSMCQMGIDCAESLPELVGSYDATLSRSISLVVPWSHVASGQRLHNQMTNLFRRWTTDDFCAAVVLFLNQFVSPVTTRQQRGKRV